MKNKFYFFLWALFIMLIIAFVPIFILWSCYGCYFDVFLILWVSFILVGIPVCIYTNKKAMIYIKELLKYYKEHIVIRAKGGTIFINVDENVLLYKGKHISLNDVVEVILERNQTIIEKTGIGESILGGVLFGGTGAIAGAMVGKKQKTKEKHKVYIRTSSIFNAGMLLFLNESRAYRLYTTLKLFIENKQRGINQ